MQRFSNSVSPGNLVRMQALKFKNKNENAGSDSTGLEWGPKLCIFNQLPDEADAAGPGATL